MYLKLNLLSISSETCFMQIWGQPEFPGFQDNYTNLMLVYILKFQYLIIAMVSSVWRDYIFQFVHVLPFTGIDNWEYAVKKKDQTTCLHY